jgi:hypothetical protein
LRCHAGEFTEPDTVNIGGKTSYLTAFGSTSKVASHVVLFPSPVVFQLELLAVAMLVR